MISFWANHVAATREEWGEQVVLSVDGDLAAERYLVVQGSDSYDEQDVKLGMNDIYVETCGQGWSWYGNIVSFELSRDGVSVQLSRKAATQMGNDGRVEVSFSLDEPEYGNLRHTLQRIFDGKDYFRDATA